MNRYPKVPDMRNSIFIRIGIIGVVAILFAIPVYMPAAAAGGSAPPRSV